MARTESGVSPEVLPSKARAGFVAHLRERGAAAALALERAVEIVKNMEGAKVSGFVFPGQRPGRPLSIMPLEMMLRRMVVDATTHDFRSSFHDWAGNETLFPREVAEHALAHVIGDKATGVRHAGPAV